MRGFSELSLRNLNLRVEATGRIALNYSGLATIESLCVDGETFTGVYVTAGSHPDLVTGEGTLRIEQSGLLIILR